MDSITRQIKMIGQRKPGRNAPYKWFKRPQGCNSESAHVNVLFSLLETLVSQHSVSLWKEMRFYKANRPGPCHWPSWSSGWDSVFSLPWPDFSLWPGNQSPASSGCRLRLPEINLNHVVLSTFTSLCNHQHHPSLEPFSFCETETLPPLKNNFPFSPWKLAGSCWAFPGTKASPCPLFLVCRKKAFIS